MSRDCIARVTRRFDTEAERVFDAWLDVQKVRQWFAPGLGPVVCVDVDARVGGGFEIVQQRGVEDVEHGGEYLELDRPRRLVFTWSVPPSTMRSRVAIDIVAQRGGCELTLCHELAPQAADLLPSVEASWRRMLDAMAATLAPVGAAA